MTTDQIGLPALERAVAAALAVPDSGLPKLRARIRHMQRFGFPPGSNVGRSGRAEYTLEDVCAVALAFAFVDAYLSPSVVVPLTLTWWPELARPMLAAAARNGGGRFSDHLPEPRCTDTIVVLRPQALTLLDAPQSVLLDDELDAIVPSTAGASTLPDMFASGGGGRRAAVLALDAGDLMSSVLASLSAEPGVDGVRLTGELDLMWRGGGWSRADSPAERPASAGQAARIGGRDRYFARTVQLLSGVRARLGTPSALDDRERRFAAYLRTPTPAEAWKRGYGAPGLPTWPGGGAHGDLSFLATVSAVLALAEVPPEDSPLLLPADLQTRMLPLGVDGTDPAAAIDAVVGIARSARAGEVGVTFRKSTGKLGRPTGRRTGLTG